MNLEFIFKIIDKEEWQKAKQTGTYNGSDKDKKDETFDQTIRDRFLNDYELASQNEYDDWQDQPMSALALVVLFDQFSRNMFRNDKKAFSQDQKTRLIVNDSVYSGYLEAMNVDQRFFMLLPLIHSEEISDHEMAYYLLNKYIREHE